MVTADGSCRNLIHRRSGLHPTLLDHSQPYGLSYWSILKNRLWSQIWTVWSRAAQWSTLKRSKYFWTSGRSFLVNGPKRPVLDRSTQVVYPLVDNFITDSYICRNSNLDVGLRHLMKARRDKFTTALFWEADFWLYLIPTHDLTSNNKPGQRGK